MKLRTLIAFTTLAATGAAGLLTPSLNDVSSDSSANVGSAPQDTPTSAQHHATMTPENITAPLTPRHIRGMCSFHFKVMERCAGKHTVGVNGYGAMGDIIGGGGDHHGHTYPKPWEHYAKWKNLEHDWKMENQFGVDGKFEIPAKRPEPVAFRWNDCEWGQYQQTNCGRCEVGAWTQGPLNCRTHRLEPRRWQDMDCFFAC